MLNFVDISSWNNANYKQAIDSADGVIIKVSEGSNYVNPYLNTYYQYAKSKGKLIGLYHYARPERCSAVDEASWFVKHAYPYLDGAVIALDWEGNALKSDQTKARQWLDIVKQMTGKKALVYCSEAYLKTVGPAVVSGDYGLWCAKYSKKKPVISPWKVMALWQYSSSPWDKSYFYGSSDTWGKYAKRV